VIAAGPGSDIRRPLGITIIGGLLVSQILTLYTTPVIYLLLDRLHRRLGGARADRAGRDAAAVAAGGAGSPSCCRGRPVGRCCLGGERLIPSHGAFTIPFWTTFPFWRRQSRSPCNKQGSGGEQR